MRATIVSVRNRFPSLKRLLKTLAQKLSTGAGVSSHYVRIWGREAEQESSRLRDAWQSRDLPTRQREHSRHNAVALQT